MREYLRLKSVYVFIACIVLSCFATSLFAQSDNGSISGYVRDPSGAIVPDVHVVIKNEGTNEEHPITTDTAGHYSVTNIQPGMYSMTAEAGGFKKFQSTQNKLNANSALLLNADLAVGQATETVEVSATASQLQTESGSVQKNVTAQQIQAQELNGRNPLYMASLVPGVRSGNTLGDFKFSLDNGGYNINGTRQQDTLITVDGAPATRTRANGTGIAVPNVDATQEIQVLTADYSAEYGRAAGGQIRIVSKSGTTDFHGAASEYFRNSAMNANAWNRNLSTTTNFTSPFRYNDFGFDIGGPVAIPHVWEKWRQKFFWFVAQEWTRDRETQTQEQVVPTALMRTGNFSELLGPNRFYSGVHQIYDPATCPKLGAASCMPFAGNIIPANRLSPNGLAILNTYPTPVPGFQDGANNWIAQAAHPINQRKGTYSGDILPNEKNHIELRRTDFSYLEYQPFDQGSGLTPKYFNRPNQINTIGWTYTINPTMINELRATMSLDDVYIPVNQSAPGFDRSAFGIDFPYLLPQGKDINGKIPTVTVPNFYGLSGGPYPSHSTGPIFTTSDSLTKVWGNHTIKVGFSFEYSGENDGDQINVNTVPGGASNQNGNFIFSDAGTGQTSGVGIANLALGRADSYTEIGPRAYTIWRSQMYEAFAQDSWQVNQKLHINYGVRETTVIPFYALWGNQDFFDPSLYNPAQAVTIDKASGNVLVGTGNQYNGVVIPGFSQFPSSAIGRVPAASNPAYNSLFNPNISKSYVQDTSQFQPRIGIAYQFDPKTVLRAGAGRFLTRMGLYDNIFPGGNSPFQPFETVNNVSVDNPGASLNPNVAAPLTITTLNRNLKPPETWNYNVTFERQLPLNSVLSVAYVGNRGLHESEVFDINQPAPGSVVSGTATSYVRPYKGFNAIQQEQSAADSRYNSLQVSWNRRFTNGGSFGVDYTLSKSMDNSSNYRDIVPDTYDTSNLWGPSEFDTRHAVTITYSYDLPFFKNQRNLAGKLIGGWQINGIAQFQTGTPCGVGSTNDYAQVGLVGSFGCGTEGQFYVVNGTAAVTGPPILGNFAGGVGANANSPKYFATTDASGNPIYTAPAAGTFNLQNNVRDTIYQPGFQNWNLGLFKKFPINERMGFEFRAEAYNFINHPNWSTVQFNPTSSTFGEVTSKSNTNPRNLQLSLRFSF